MTLKNEINENISVRNFKNKNSFRIAIICKTRNIRSLFSLKNKNDYKSWDIYKVICSCGSRYINKTKRNSKVRSNKSNNTNKSLESSKLLWRNIDNCFTWAIILNTTKHGRISKNLKALYIALWKLDLNRKKCFCCG